MVTLGPYRDRPYSLADELTGITERARAEAREKGKAFWKTEIVGKCHSRAKEGYCSLSIYVLGICAFWDGVVEAATQDNIRASFKMSGENAAYFDAQWGNDKEA